MPENEWIPISFGLFFAGQIELAKGLMMVIVSFPVFKNVAAAGSTISMFRMTSTSIRQAYDSGRRRRSSFRRRKARDKYRKGNT